MSVFVSDTFTGSDGTDLTAHTGEIGATWTKHTLFTSAVTIKSNRAEKGAATAAAVYYASGVPPQLNYTIEADIVDIGDVSRAAGIFGWIDTASDHMIGVRRQTSTAWQLLKIIGGVATSIDTEATTFSALAVRHLKLTRTGDNFEWFLDGGSLGTFTISDAEFQSVGRVGIRASNDHVGTGYHIDNLSASTPDDVASVKLAKRSLRPAIFTPGLAR